MTQINNLSAIDTPSGGDQLPVFSTGNGDARKLALSRLATWLSTAMESLTVTQFIRVQPVLVSDLPSAASVGAGARAFVTDANSIAFNDLAVGSGANAVPVFSDGGNWRIG